MANNEIQSLLEMMSKSPQTSKGMVEKTKNIRQGVCHMINNFCTDIEKLTEDAESSKCCQMSLEFLSHCIEYLPHVFVFGPHISDMPSLSQQKQAEPHQEDIICQNMTMWTLSRLLRILAVEECRNLHDRALNIACELVNLIKGKDHYNFHLIMMETLAAMSDLVSINQKFYSNDDDDENYTGILNRFIVSSTQSQNVDMVNQKITIRDEEICEKLQISVTQLLIETIVSDCIFIPNVKALWGSLCLQIELGDIPLKKVSLLALDKVCRHGELPSEIVLDYYIDCLCALLEMISSDEKQELKQSDVEELEERLSGCLMQLLSAHKKTIVGNRLTVSQIVNLMDSIVTLLTKRRINELSTILQQSLINLVTDFYNILPKSNLISASLVTKRKLLVENLIEEIGTTRKLLFISPLIISEIKLELDEIQNQSSKTETKADEAVKSISPDHGDAEPLAKRQKLDIDTPSQKGSGDVKSTVFVMNLLTKKYDDLMREISTEEPGIKDCCRDDVIIEGIQLVIDIWVQCCNDSTIENSLMKNMHLTGSEGKAFFCHLVDIKVLCECIKNLLKQFASVRYPLHVIPVTYTSVVQMLGAILTLQDLKMPPNVCQTITWILTLPWLPTDMTWLDLKPSNSKEIGKLAGKLADKLNSSTLCEIIHVLAIMPKDYSPQWRAKVMKIAGEDSDENLRRAVIEHFPRLLYHYGPNGNHLVYDILHGILKMKTLSTAEQEMLANIYGKLACVISRKALLKSTSQSRLSTPCYENMPIQCYSCDDIIDEEGHQRSPHSRPKIVDPTMFLPFLNLLTSEQPIEVKTALVKSFKRLFGHIGVRANNPATVDMLNKCLTVIEDPDYNIRVLFSEAVQYLISDSKGDTTTETDQVIISKLKAAYERGQDSSNLRLQETILITLGHMGRIAEGSLLLVAVISLLESLLSAMPLISAVAYEQIQGVSKSKGVKMQALFMQFRHQICKFLGDAMHSKQMNHAEYSKPPLEMLQAIVNVFDFSDIKSFLKSTEKFLLPHLVSKATPAATAIIKILADELNQRRKKLLISSTKHIFSYIVRTCSEKQDLEKALGYLQNETGLEMGSLLRLDCQRVHNELLMYLSTHYSQVFQALAMLASNDDAYDGPKDITKSSDMARFLQPRLLGILASFDSTLLMTSVPLEEKKLALESLISIMKLMGQKYITTVRVKVMTTLRIGLRFKEAGFPEVSCRAWNCFVHSVELISLGPMLSQIVVTLLPLLYQLPKQVAEIFTFLTVENRKSLAQHLHELYFMPDLPELTEVNSVLRKYHEAAQRKADLSTKISNSLKGITHESLDVRLYALQKLKQLLRSQQKELHEYIMGKERTDPIISQMVSVLLNGCRETDMKTKALFGECLGEIGGIDPGRLDLKTHTSQDDAFQANVNDRNFTIYLINELARAFLAAEDTRTQDCSAFAIQEIIQIYEITDCVDGNLAGRKLWNCFPGHIQEILAPLLNSRYILNANVTSNWSNITKPIYHSRKGQSFKSWVCTWTGFLISKVVQEKALKVFQACSAVIKHNINIALYLLPHILLQVLLDSKDCTANEICCEILEVLRHVMKQESRQISVSDFRHMGAQTIFSVLDHLFKWKRHRLGLLSAKSSSMISRDISQDASYINDDNYRTVCEFVDKIPQDLLAHASYNCKAYTRAIMHLELFMRNNDRQNQQENLDFLQKLYVAMDEPDGVAGVAAIRQDNQTLDEQILLHTSIGQLQDATACYEQAIKLQPNDLSLHQGLLKCFMDLGQLNKALTHATGVISERPKWSNRVNSYRVEAAWKLAKWDDLQKFTAQETGNSNWGVGLGKILLAAKNKKENDFFKELEAVRLEQMGPLSAASMEAGSYQRGYEHIVRLHILNEIEQGVKTLLNIGLTDEVENTMNIAQIFSHWDSRLALTQSSFRTQDPILNVRAILITLANEESNDNLEKSLGQIWLQKARVARKADHVQTAYSSLLSASDFGLAEFWVEKAKWFYHKGDPDQAKAVLEKGVAKHYSDWKKFQTIDENDENVLEERLRYAKALLLIGRYSDETASVETNKIVRQFRDVIDVNPDWEGGYFYLAKYYDKVMTNMCDTAESRSGQKGYLSNSCSGFLMHIVQNFGKSLQCGNQYIYQSMPRMLTLWLDYGAQVAEEQKMKKSSNQANLSQHNHMTALSSLNKLIEDFRVKIQPYQFLTALPQLISRICHAQPEVFNRLMSIISTVLGTYPQQSMWLMMAVSKSSVTVRVKRCIEIFSRAKQANPDLVKFLADATKLVDRLLELCNKPVEKNVTTLSISQHFKSLKRLVDDKNFSSIMLPLQSTLTPSLPITPGCHADHNPFPGQQVYLSGFEDAVDILHSLQKPKKITMRGSDGKPYIMMCKPKDDLRKDCRLMEFNGIVNKCLRKDPESRKRNLHIRTYAVIPLNEECGLLEWVPHTHGFRHILTKSYKERGNFMTPREVFAVKPTLQMSTESKLHIYKSKLLPRHPPVFSEWFLQTFPDPTSWYMARLSYARTAAVMSMVGYILGLGDRHGENILFDSTTGDCVHVDFNCLFNKGEGFDWPELVPFRLTHNMVDALGPTGYEGIFRTACEVTMRLMRNEKDPLMSVLKTFIYDPLVEWSKPVKSRNEQSAVTRGGKVVRANEFGEIKNEMAQSNVQNIEHRLNGITKNNTVRRGLPLSIEGQVNYLIQEAISEANLCKMYIGWSAYM